MYNEHVKTCIITDFDGTVTLPTMSTIGVFRRVFGEDYKKELRELFQKLLNAELPSFEKTRLYAQEELKVISKFLRREFDIHSIAQLFEIRPGYEKTIDFLSSKNIPLYISSSGIGNNIELVLKYYGLDYYEYICANYYDENCNFDYNGVIWSYRKYNETFLNRIKDYENLILVGDSECDLNMVPSDYRFQSIAFNNKNINEDTTKYDIVLPGKSDYFAGLKRVLK